MLVEFWKSTRGPNTPARGAERTTPDLQAIASAADPSSIRCSDAIMRCELAVFAWSSLQNGMILTEFKLSRLGLQFVVWLISCFFLCVFNAVSRGFFVDCLLSWLIVWLIGRSAEVNIYIYIYINCWSQQIFSTIEQIIQQLLSFGNLKEKSQPMISTGSINSTADLNRESQQISSTVDLKR